MLVSRLPCNIAGRKHNGGHSLFRLRRRGETWTEYLGEVVVGKDSEQAVEGIVVVVVHFMLSAFCTLVFDGFATHRLFAIRADKRMVLHRGVAVWTYEFLKEY